MSLERVKKLIKEDPRMVFIFGVDAFDGARMLTRALLVANNPEIMNTIDPVTYFILNNMGNLFNGANISFLTDYYGERIGIPDNVRRPLVLGASLLGVTAIETIVPLGTHEALDLPAGFAGSIIYDRLRFGRFRNSKFLTKQG